MGIKVENRLPMLQVCTLSGIVRFKLHFSLPSTMTNFHGIGCDAEDPDAPGCCFGFHKSYDDE